jgi:membrane protease YdiL (CAAX protease family)
MLDTDIAKRRYYALMILGIVLPFLLTIFFSAIFSSAGQSMAYRLTCSRFVIWAVLILMFLYARYAEVQLFFLWQDEKYDFSFYFTSFIALYLCTFAGGIIAHTPYWLGLREKSEMLHKVTQVMGQYPIILVFTVITAGITEEFIFRAYMIPRLSLLFTNKSLPVIISAALFAAIHLGYKNLGEIIFALIFGLVFGYHYQKYRNIKILVVMHALWDLMASLIAMHHKIA